jgi:predicted AAA+ superfamily ATPase
MMIVRQAAEKVLQLSRQMKAVAIVGPRQSGKTTLCRLCFPEKPYVSLENPANLRFAQEDPQRFLERYPNGAIFDEVQRVPEIFSWLQGILDEKPEAKGRFILSGSNNFLLLEKITQTLAGRVGYLDLLPFSLAEATPPLAGPGSDLDSILWQGRYPPIVADGVDAQDWLASYIRTYVERDVRQIRNIQNLQLFNKLLVLCAARIGTPFNASNLCIELGVSRATLEDWLSILQASYIIWLMPPYHANFNKRILKTPKIYFHDTGLAAYLLDIASPQILSISPFRGPLFENFVLTELLKNRFNHGLRSNLFFWQDSNGREVDLLLQSAKGPFPIEIKSGHTPQNEFFKNIRYLNKLTQTSRGAVLYGGDESYEREAGLHLLSWRFLAEGNMGVFSA